MFVFLYLFIAIDNVSKTFITWDEFSHWGLFLKENLRLDKLYCTSPISISHKDYVPAITVFETIWCKLTFRYVEADVYRAIQILQFSFVLPMVSPNNNSEMQIVVHNSEKKLQVNTYQITKYFTYLIIIMMIPLFVCKFDGMMLYHSIYKDMPIAFLIFYCIYIANEEYDNTNYQIFLLTISLTFTILSKMIAIIFLPLIVFYYIFNRLVLYKHSKNSQKQIFKMVLIPTIIPLLIWKVVNDYIKKYVGASNGTKSFSGFRLDTLYRFIKPKDIQYQLRIKQNYVEALLKKPIFGSLSYIILFSFLIVLFFIAIAIQKNNREKKRTTILLLWIIFVAITYVIIMYFLYCVSFGEYEAMRLASYERYMNTFAFAAVLLTTYLYMCCIDYKKIDFINKLSVCKRFLVPGVIIVTCCIDLIFNYTNHLTQVAPPVWFSSIYNYDYMIKTQRDSLSKPIIENTLANPNERIFCICCGDAGVLQTYINYDSSPRYVLSETRYKPKLTIVKNH